MVKFTVTKDDKLKKGDGVCVQDSLKKDIKSSTFEEERQKFKKEIDYHRYWKDMYEKEHKLRLEAEGETTIVKGIGINSPEMKEAKERVKELDKSLAISLEINESHQRYNGKLQTRVTELEEDNKKLSSQIEDKIDTLRKAGL